MVYSTLAGCECFLNETGKFQFCKPPITAGTEYVESLVTSVARLTGSGFCALGSKAPEG